ncbi:GGDEF domain-containing protein [Marinicella meishanensis]|uniref:GGDEF domain-containing protein n=1 Tax=Marinicella meishanensis TaxID=2873263 RepID=UPI001CBF42BC|nr:GGDEF domain-containing protein [Marinicella sp. NBU2979]
MAVPVGDFAEITDLFSPCVELLAFNMPLLSKIIVVILALAGFVIYDIAYLEPVDDIRVFNVVFEFSFAIMALVMFLVIESLKGKSFYQFLNAGFLLLFISMYVDGLDQFYLHGEMYTAVAEKATMFTGFILLFVGINKWIVEHGNLNKKLENQAFTDELTGLYNRRGLLKKFEAMMMQADAEGQAMSIIIADLDDFKEFNDTFGHLAGDDFLAELGCHLLGMMGEQQVIGRWGGEEFAIGLLGSELQQALAFAERLRLNVAQIELPKGMSKHRVTISMGVCEKAADESLMDAVKRADRSLYQAKNLGKNQAIAS